VDKESNHTKPETVEPDSGPTLDLATISQLVELARRGDRVAQSEICRQVQGHLIRLADRQLDQAMRGKVNPSDIVQASLSRMIHGFVDFRSSSTAEFYARLNSILNNEIRTTRRDLRRGRRDVRLEVLADGMFTPTVLPRLNQVLRSSMNPLYKSSTDTTRLGSDFARLVDGYTDPFESADAHAGMAALMD